MARPIRISLLTAALAPALICAAPAAANDGAEFADAAPLAAATGLIADARPRPELVADDNLPPPRVRIAIGPEYVEPGALRYADRATAPGKAAIVAFSATPPPAPGGPRGAGGVPAGLPLASARLTSGFGWRVHPLSGGWRAHSGVDLAAPYGSPIVATAGGVVAVAGWTGGYGLLVSLAHGDGVQTRYGHLSRLAVAPGQQVRAGEVIGYVGSTGESTGPHVHYEVRIDGRAVDPLR